MGLTVNGTTYDVNVEYGSIIRSVSAISGSNAGTMLNKVEFADVIGTSIQYTLNIEPNPSNRTAYDTLYELLATPANYLTFSGLPYGQTTQSFRGRVASMSDKYKGVSNGVKRWTGLQLVIKAIDPYKVTQ